MKRIALLLLAACGLMIAACTQSIPDKLTKLADQAEAKGAKWSQDKWEEVATEFSGLLDEFTAKEDSYGPFKKLKVLAATTKFYAAAAKYVVAPEAKAKIQGLSEEADEEKGEMSDLEKAIADGADELLEGLKGLGL